MGDWIVAMLTVDRVLTRAASIFYYINNNKHWMRTYRATILCSGRVDCFFSSPRPLLCFVFNFILVHSILRYHKPIICIMTCRMHTANKRVFCVPRIVWFCLHCRYGKKETTTTTKRRQNWYGFIFCRTIIKIIVCTRLEQQASASHSHTALNTGDTCGLPHITQMRDLSNTIYENDRTLASCISHAAAFHFILICRKCNKIEVQSFLVFQIKIVSIYWAEIQYLFSNERKKKKGWQNREQRTARGEHFR